MFNQLEEWEEADYESSPDSCVSMRLQDSHSHLARSVLDPVHSIACFMHASVAAGLYPIEPPIGCSKPSVSDVHQTQTDGRACVQVLVVH